MGSLATIAIPEQAIARPAVRQTGTTLERRIDGRLWLLRASGDLPVSVMPCFPWSEPTRFLSLRDVDGEELTLIEDAADLDPDSREILEEALVGAGFVFQLTGVQAIDEEVEIRNWRVTTKQGERQFQTRLDEWPRALPGGSMLIRDVAGDLYSLQDPAALDAKSRDLLWSFLD